MGHVVNIVVINVISEYDIEEALDITYLPFYIHPSSLFTLFCILGGWLPWTISLALRLLVRFCRWEIMELGGPEESEERAISLGFLSATSPWFGFVSLAKATALSRDLLHTQPVCATSSLLPCKPRCGNCSPRLLASGCCPAPGESP